MDHGSKSLVSRKCVFRLFPHFCAADSGEIGGAGSLPALVGCGGSVRDVGAHRRCTGYDSGTGGGILTTGEVLERLFTLANALADQEASSDYAGIAQVQGRDSCSFLEHLGELPPAGQIGLLRALIKRRFAMEGFRPSEMALSMSEQLEVNHWLKHNNSMHGTRPTEFLRRACVKKNLRGPPARRHVHLPKTFGQLSGTDLAELPLESK